MENIKQKPEDYFVLLLQKNKSVAFQYAFDTFWNRLYQQAVYKVKCEVSAKDLVQDVFVVLWSKIGQFNPDQNVMAFLYVVLRHKILKFFERNQIHLKYVYHSQTSVVNDDRDAERVLIGKELQQQMNAEVGALPQRMRKIYVLKREEGYSIREIAENLSISEQTVRNQLHFAYTRIKSGLKTYQQ